MIKKSLILISLLTFSILFFGCIKTENTSNPKEKNPTVENVAPSKDNTNSNDNESTPNKESDKNTIIEEDTKQNSPTIEKKSVRIYYFNIDTGVVYTNLETDVVDKSLTKSLVTELKKPLNNEYQAVIPKNTEVTKAILNRDSKNLTVYFKNSIIPSGGYGSSAEAMFIQSLVNTLGYNYNVETVTLFIDGKPYSSGHLSMDMPGTFKVNYENCKKL